MIGITDLKSDKPQIKRESKELVERTLEGLAPALYRGMSVAYVEYDEITTNIMQ